MPILRKKEIMSKEMEDNLCSLIPAFYGKKVRLKRKQLKMSQGELAEKTGLHFTYISSVERGERNISIINVGKIARALRSKMADFFPDD